MGSKGTTLTPIKDIISGLLNEGTLPFDLADARIWEVWAEVVGPAIARNAHPSWIKNRTLRVRVSDPIWLQELQFSEEEIRARLNRRLGREAVEVIEFRADYR